ncbi:chromo domain-containing protein [Trichonephila clavipes]|uniref:Chromo domain-containing protein n=1 Tax=Trichonephila clavipes TaxID=2585209 RepID=A0A8X6RBS3_TRICX|nr:chromo domain-containing protein [Trichonephila clavipes]
MFSSHRCRLWTKPPTLFSRTIVLETIQVLKNLYGDLRNEKPKAPRFKIGDVVRINKQKIHFEKEYEQNWRRELFTVYEIVQRILIVYRLKYLQGEEIKGTYYEAELQKVVDSGF